MKKKILSFLLSASLLAAAVVPASPVTAQGTNSSSRVDNDAVVTSKTVTTEEDGSYTLRLESYVTGATMTSTTQKPTDTILVFDTSGSMDDYIDVADKNSVAELDPQYADYYKWNGGVFWHDMRYVDGKWQYDSLLGWKDCGDSWFGNNAGIKKINALRIAANEFIDSTYEKGGDNRIAIVTYASSASVKNGLTDVATGTQNLKNTINNLSANGTTAADYGMYEAQNIINNISKDRDSVKTVIMFTDGEPNHGNGFNTTVANSTINYSKNMKDKGTTVYTVGVYEGADPTDNSANINKYLHRVSSNYLDATNINNGTLNSQVDPFNGGKSYYLSADNLQALSDIFQSISDEIGGASIELDENSIVTDVISDYFELKGSANNIVVKTADCTSFNADTPIWTNEQVVNLTPTVDGKTISVSGFNFSENWVGKNETTGVVHPGKKLIIEIPIERRDGFLGGNLVPTNGGDSGIYTSSEELVENFEIPTVDVPIADVTVNAQDKNIYLLDSLSADQLKTDATTNVGNVQLRLDQNNFGLQEWQNAFVDINVTAPSDKTNLTDDTNTYELSVSVTPKTEGTVTGKTGSDSAYIYVFKPVITWQDSQINAGETANYKDNLVSEVWKHGTTVDETVTMTGTAPTLTYEYNPEAGAFTQETPVTVTVKIGDREINQYINFLHANNCTFPDCKWDEVYKNQDYHFVVHIKSFELTIEKTGCEAIDENQSFVFSVTGPNGYSTQVVIKGNDSVTIKDLPAGTYTITEDTSWSWRYEPTANSQTVTVDHVENGTATVTFNNTRNNEQWLDGNAYEWNLFDGSND